MAVLTALPALWLYEVDDEMEDGVDGEIGDDQVNIYLVRGKRRMGRKAPRTQLAKHISTIFF